MKKILVFVLIIFSTVYAISQGCYSDILLKNTTIGGVPAIAATGGLVNVCLETDKAVPCTTMSVVLLYSDSALTKPIANPVSTDNKGNYSWCAASGTYNQQPTGSGIITKTSGPITIPISQASSQALSDAAPHNFTNTITTSGAFTANGKFRTRECAGANSYCTDPDLDPTLNECAAINAAWPYALSKGWTGLHIVSGWHGVQACGTSDPNANYPSVINANPPTFAAVLDMQPDNIIQTDNPVVIRTNQKWDFHNPHSGLGSTTNAIVGGFQSSNAFTTGAVVEYGAPDGTSVTSGGQPQGVQLENAGVYCRGPNGTFRSGSIGVRNQYSQEQSWGKNLRIDGCQYGIDKQDSGTGFGSINDGPWEDLHINVGGSNTASSQCIRIGKAGSANADVQNARGFYHISCNTNGATVQPTYGVTVDGVGIPIVDLHTEGFATAVGLGELGYSKGNTVRDVFCVALGTFTIGTCVDIGANNEFGNTNGNVIANVNVSGTATNVFCDNRNTPACATPATTNTLAFYVHALGGMIISSSPEIPSRMTFATGASLNSLTSPTANAIFAMGGFKLELDGSASQATSLLSLQGQASNTNAIPLLNVTTGSATEKAFSFCTAGKGCIASDASDNLQLTNTQTATSGANFDSPSIFVQGRYWNSSASAGETVTQQFKYGTGANPTATYSFALAGAGTGVHSMDFSNWAKVLSKNISTGTASNTDLTGTIAISASTTGTYTFAQTYASAPICQLTPTSDPTATGVYWATATTTVLTANVKTSGTITFNYQCVGRN